MIDKKDRKLKAIEQARTKKTRIIILSVIVAAVSASGLGWFINLQNQQAQQEQTQVKKEMDGYPISTASVKALIVEGEKKHPIQSRSHVRARQPHKAYTTNPPTSGPHTSPERGGFFTGKIADEMAVHNLEHGYVWITYKNISEDQVVEVRKLAGDRPNGIIASERKDNDTNGVILVSWGKTLTLSRYDEKLVTDFIKRNINKSPERLAR